MSEPNDSQFSYKEILEGLILDKGKSKLPITKGRGQKKMGSFIYERGAEQAVCERSWVPASEFIKQIESVEEERLKRLFDKVCDETLQLEALNGLEQDEISEQLVKGNIPKGMDFFQFLEMIESASIIEEDF